jgi:hypothetical protein
MNEKKEKKEITRKKSPNHFLGTAWARGACVFAVFGCFGAVG